MTTGQSWGSGSGAAMAAGLRLAGFLGLIAVLAPLQAGFLLWKRDDPFRIPQLFHRMMLRLLGFRVRVHGAMAQTAPVLFAANHSSYLDIPVLGALIPASFVAKAEVARWPLFSVLAKLQQTVFIERRPAQARNHSDGLRARLERGRSLILFPEGTSSEGLSALPFKSSLFAAMENMRPDVPVVVQPVSITCTELDGLPITRAFRPWYAWFGDMTMAKHLWNVFRIGRFTVDVVFHPPVKPEAFTDRKALAAYCREQVAHGIEQCLTGRHVFPEAAPKLAPPAGSALIDAKT